MNIHCIECGARLRQVTPSLWISLTRAPCISATGDHLPDPLDVALRRVREAEDAVRDAHADLAEAREEYDYLRIVRVKR